MRWLVAGVLLAATTGCFLLDGGEASCAEDADCSGAETCRDGECVAVCVPKSQDEACAALLEGGEADNGCGASLSCPCVDEPIEVLCVGAGPTESRAGRCGNRRRCPCEDEPIDEVCAGTTPGSSFRGRCGQVRHCPCIDDCPEPADGSINACGDVCVPLVDGFQLLDASGPAPDARSYAGVAWDPIAGTGLVEGGEVRLDSTNVAAVAGVHSFLLALVGGNATVQWNDLSANSCPDGPPEPALSHGLTYHPGLGGIVRFGGWSGRTSTRVVPDTYAWDGACFGGLPSLDLGGAGAPSARYEFQSATDDGRRGEVFLLGGLTGSESCSRGEIPRDELWRWGPEGWSVERLALEGADGGPADGYRSLHVAGASWDPLRGMVVFGGATLCDETGAEGTITAHTLVISTEPPATARWFEAGTDVGGADQPRERLAMAASLDTGVVVRTGGKSSKSIYTLGSYLMDADETWRELEGLDPPAPMTTGARLIEVPGWGLVHFGGYEKSLNSDYSNAVRLLSNRALRKRTGQSTRP